MIWGWENYQEILIQEWTYPLKHFNTHQKKMDSHLKPMKSGWTPLKFGLKSLASNIRLIKLIFASLMSYSFWCITGAVAAPVSTPASAPASTAAPLLGFGDKFKKPEGSWECEVCCVPNKAEDQQCVACQSAKPGAKIESKGKVPCNHISRSVWSSCLLFCRSGLMTRILAVFQVLVHLLAFSPTVQTRVRLVLSLVPARRTRPLLD